MGRGNGIKIFRGVMLVIFGFVFGLGLSVLAWVNPSQSPPLGGGVLQTDTSGLKIVTTTQITAGNFTVNNGNVGIGITNPNNRLQVIDLINFNNTNFNTFLGYQAGKNVAPGASRNTFIGYQAGFASSTGTSNTGYQNIAIGHQALFSNTTGYSNTALGSYALFSNTTGYYNNALGSQALFSNTTGYYNTALGSDALYFNNTGYSNAALGYRALFFNTIGSYNTALGDQALFSNTTGSNNTALGSLALYFNTTGYSNTALGYYAGSSVANGPANSTSTNSVYIGANTKASFSGADNEIVIGNNAVGAGSNSVVLGNDGISKTILKGNVGIGTTSPENSAGWNRVLDVYGFSHSRIIASANNLRTVLTSHTGNFYGTLAGGIIGTETAHPLYFITGSSTRVTIATSGDVGIGTIEPGSKLDVVGTVHIRGVGDGTGLYVNSSGNVGIGTTSPENSAGWNRVLDVYGFSHSRIIASANNLRTVLTSHTGNFYGSSAGGKIGTETAHPLYFITGSSTRVTIATSGNVGIGTTNPTYKLDVAGDIRTTGCLIYNGGTLGTCVSDIRLKDNIINLSFDNALTKVLSLQPKQFTLKNDPSQKISGLIAQEIEQFVPELVATDEKGYKQIKYGDIQWLLIEAIKEQQKEIEELKSKISR